MVVWCISNHTCSIGVFELDLPVLHKLLKAGFATSKTASHPTCSAHQAYTPCSSLQCTALLDASMSCHVMSCHFMSCHVMSLQYITLSQNHQYYITLLRMGTMYSFECNTGQQPEQCHRLAVVSQHSRGLRMYA